MTLKLIFLLYGTYIFAEIDRRDGALNYFNVANHGRLDYHSVLMFLEDLSLNSCINYCVMHLQCLSVSYSSTARLCELNDVEFDEVEADVKAIGWMNYGTPQKVHGKFSEWKIKTPCTNTCGSGVIVYSRLCDNPRPQYGGEECEGAYEKTESCLTKCIVHGNYSDWMIKTPCSTTCEDGTITYNRFCNNPVPQNGGNQCEGPDEKTESCFVPCPLGENVAVGKPSKQESTYVRKEEDWKAHNANDGNYNTVSATSRIDTPWWQVDLGEVVRIRLITIQIPQHPFKTKMNKKVRIVTNTDEKLRWNTCTNHVMFSAVKVNVTCESGASESARYVRIQEMDRVKKKTHILYLSEVEVYKW